MSFFPPKSGSWIAVRHYDVRPQRKVTPTGVFEVPFDAIAAILGRSTAATKMLASRARGRIRQVHSFLATSGPVMRASSGKVAAMMPIDTMIPPAVRR